MCHGNEEWYKNWEGTDFSFENWHELLKIWPEHSKGRHFFLIGSLWPKYILLKLQKYRGVMFDDTEEYANFEERVIVIKMKNFEERLTSGLKKDMRNLADFHQST